MAAEDGGVVTAAHFEERVKHLRDALPDGVEGWAVLRGAHDDSMPTYAPTFTAQVHLLKAEVPNTLVLITRNHTFVASRLTEKKTLGALRGAKDTTCLQVTPKQDVNGAAFDQALAGMEGKRLGIFTDDVKLLKGPFFAEKFMAMLAEKKVETVDMAPTLYPLLRVKSEEEVGLHRKAGTFCGIVTQRFAYKKLQEAPEFETVPSALSIADAISSKIDYPEGLKGAENVTDTTRAFDAVVQSGNFPADPMVVDSEDAPFALTNIVTLIGVRWMHCCALVGRTYVVDPTDKQRSEYDALLALRDGLCRKLVPGAKISDVVKEAKALLPEALRGNLYGELGFGTGIEVRDAALALTETNETVLTEGMVLVTRLRLQDLGFEGGDKYVLQLVDTVVVAKPDEEKPLANVVTNGAKSAAGAVLWAREQEMEPTDQMELRKTTEHFDSSRAGQWAKAQAEILQENRKEQMKLTGGDLGGVRSKDKSFAGALARNEYTAGYVEGKPKDQLTVDVAKDMIYFPLCGEVVGVHGSMLSSTRKEVTADGNYAMQLMFKATSNKFTPYNIHPKLAFLKKVTLKATIDDQADLEAKRAVIRTIINQMGKKDVTGTLGAQAVAQDGLKLRPGGGNPKIPQVSLRPSAAKGKSKARGDFEAHENGLRFQPADRTVQPVDVLLSNVKHLIACPHARGHERTAGIHIVLHNPIQLEGKATTRHLQVWTEVREEGENIDGKKRSADDYREEHEEQAIIAKINKEFIRFVTAMQGRLPKGTCEIPFPDGYFEGTAGDILGPITTTPSTMHTVLDTPPSAFFVITMSEVEVVIFERVVQGQNNFDMVFVMKDFTQPVQTISMIQMRNLPQIKDALCNVYRKKYYESSTTMQWTHVLKNIRDCIQAEEWDPWGVGSPNGWEQMFNPDGEAGEEDEEDEDDDTDSSDVYSSDSESDSDTTFSTDSGSATTSQEEEDSSTSMSESEGDRRAKKKDKRSKKEHKDAPPKKRKRD